MTGSRDEGPRVAGTWALAAVAALLLGGCGTGADATQARTATEHFLTASRQHDGRRACGQLSTALRQQLVQDEGTATCARAVLKVKLRGARTEAVRVYATSAQVTLAGGDTMFLGATSHGWRIETIGCRPSGPGPYDCEAQARWAASA